MEVRAEASRDTLVQGGVVMVALLPTDCLLVQPRAEWYAGHLGIGTLQVGSWRRRKQRRNASEQPWESAHPGGILALPCDEPSGFRQVPYPL